MGGYFSSFAQQAEGATHRARNTRGIAIPLVSLPRLRFGSLKRIPQPISKEMR